MMTMAELELPVRKWVPDWLGVVSMFAVILPVTMLNGSYAGSMLEVSSTLGTNSEDITMGFYATSAGMAMAYPIIPKVMKVISSKLMLLVDLTLQFLLSWLCARSQSADVLIVCSFFIGFLKGFLMMWGIHRMHKMFSPNNVRSEFYAYFYPLVYGGGQLSMIITAELAYHYDWKYMYYFMMSLLLLAILRLMRPAALIPATTALATLSPEGRRLGILSGANVVMPNLSPAAQRAKYAIYEHKAAFGCEAAEGLAALERELASVGYRIDYARGDYEE